MLLHLQAEQIVTNLMMNMLAVDKRLAEEQNRQAMVSENMQIVTFGAFVFYMNLK